MEVINKTKLSSVLQMSKQHQTQLIIMVQNMLNAAEDNIALLLQWHLHQQFADMQPLLHKIRGSFATLGAELLADKTKQLEVQIEQKQAISDELMQGVVAIYRQTCNAISDELSLYQSAPNYDAEKLDVSLLHDLLLKQDMQATDVAQSSRQALTALLGTEDAERFYQLVNNLGFVDAAKLLQPHVASIEQG